MLTTIGIIIAFIIVVPIVTACAFHAMLRLDMKRRDENPVKASKEIYSQFS